ncbi:MAG: HAD family phosphatase [Eubacteriaceae bacterium]|nr:HAD family phosphatase [Eubacteriaceae bacterium]
MNQIKLAAFDIDDTLLNKDNELPESTLETLQKAHKNGVIITLVSGRAYPSAYKIAQKLSFNVPIICYNGAMIKEADNSTPIFISNVEQEIVHQMVDYCHKYGLYLQIYDEQDNIVVEKINEKTLADPDYYNTGCREAGDFNKLKNINTPKMMIFDKPDNIVRLQAELQSIFRERLYFTQSKSHLLEMMAPGVNKAVSLARFAESLSLSSCEVMACGDNANDIEMVKWAGVGVAVANATPELKAVADYVCKYERSDGVAEAIEKLILFNKI